MQLEHTFIVPLPADQAWPVMLDVERVAACMPGATLESIDGDDVLALMKVKLGPASMTYQGSARFVEKDEAARRVVIEASGKERKGAGTASATVWTSLQEHGGETEVHVSTELSLTGKPAQFGRGAMQEVSSNLIDRFADSLAAELSAKRPGGDSRGGEPPGPPTSPEDATSSPLTAAPLIAESRRRVADNTLDLFDLVKPTARRATPIAGGLVLITLFVWLLRRREGASEARSGLRSSQGRGRD